MKLYNPAVVAVAAMVIATRHHGGSLNPDAVLIALGIAGVILVVGAVVAYLLNR